MIWKSLFSKPFTLKKCLIIILLLALLAAVVYGLRLVYVMFVNPVVAFDPPAVAVLDETPRPELPAVSMEGEPVGTPVPTIDPEAQLISQADLEFMKDRVNILLVGFDENEDRDQTNRVDYRSDVLILLSVDFANKKVDMISVPRDSYVPQYNTAGRWKINACFAHGGGFDKDGFLYARETVSMVFGGIPIPYHIGVQMDGVKRVVDALGGVDYDVDVEIRLNGRVLEKGPQHLNGQQVLDYCRARKGISTDVGRNDRQQRILFAIFNQLKSQGRLTQVPEIYNAVKDDIYTNLNLEQIAALAVLGLNMDHEKNLNRYTLQGEYLTNVYNFSFYALYQQKKCDLVKQIFGVTIKPDQTYDASFIKVDWACIQGEAAIQAARETLAGLPAWVQTGEVEALISSLSGDIEAARSSPYSASSAEINSAISLLRANVEALRQQVQQAQQPQEQTGPAVSPPTVDDQWN